jgi:hypothetical protein
VTIIASCVGLLLAVIAFLAVYFFRRRFFRRRPEKRFPALGSLRMCPHCGRITARAQAACLECGKALA